MINLSSIETGQINVVSHVFVSFLKIKRHSENFKLISPRFNNLFRTFSKFNTPICFAIFPIFSDRGAQFCYFSTSFHRRLSALAENFPTPNRLFLFLFFWMQNFLPPHRSLHRLHSPFSVTVCLTVHRGSLYRSVEPEVRGRTATKLRSLVSRSGLDGPSTSLLQFFLLSLIYFIIAWCREKFTLLTVNRVPFFKNFHQFRFLSLFSVQPWTWFLIGKKREAGVSVENLVIVSLEREISCCFLLDFTSLLVNLKFSLEKGLSPPFTQLSSITEFRFFIILPLIN